MRTKSDRLTERQKAIILFIEKHVQQFGFPPTIREIGEATGIASTSVVNYNLNKLTRLGMLTRTSTKSRGLKIVPEKLPSALRRQTFGSVVPPVRPSVRVPFAGTIVAGQPLPVPDDNPYLHDDESRLELTPSMLGGADPEQVFALRVKGDSMIDAMIQEGDWVILRAASDVRSGDMAAVWLEDRGETTLKYVYFEGEALRLQPAHPTMEAIRVPANRARIQGKVVSVLRVLK
jgi:repressor LexA